MRLAKAIEESPIVPPCMNTDPEIWFGDPNNNYDHTAMAKKLCKLCPARKACAEYAIAANELYGIWGGTSRYERIQVRKSKAA